MGFSKITSVNTEPISIDGVAGPIVVTTNALLGNPKVTVGGVSAPRSGRRQYTLPATDGSAVDATVRIAFADPYPTVEISGVRHRTGPSIPVMLRVLAPLPLLLVTIGGALGGLVGALGLWANLHVARIQAGSAAKAMAMVGVSAVSYLLLFAVAVGIRAAISPS